MKIDKYNIVVDPQYYYKRLDPIPTAEEVSSFYREKYYNLVAEGGKAPELNKILKGGEDLQTELEWFSQTLWRDIKDTLEELLTKNQKLRLLDVGCGTGHFGKYLVDAGWDVTGIEPSKDAVQLAKSLGFEVYDTLEGCLGHETRKFDAITLLNVLEDVPDPVSFLQNVINFMDAQSILVIRVPNDFSRLQEIARKTLGINPWWIAIPDHVNYFNLESLEKFIMKLGLKIVAMSADFPMEMFLLFGDNYVENPDLGNICHRKRMNFELSIPDNLRRSIYKCFANNDIGRNIIVFAKLNSIDGEKL